MCSVYIIGLLGFVKIGVSLYPGKRIGNMFANHPNLTPRILFVFTVEDVRQAHAIESYLHTCCGDNRIKGEWFKENRMFYRQIKNALNIVLSGDKLIHYVIAEGRLGLWWRRFVKHGWLFWHGMRLNHLKFKAYEEISA